MVTPSFPYVVAIQVNKAAGGGRANASLQLTNVNTGEVVTFTANSSGQYIYDLGNLSEGYTNGDVIKVKQVISEDNVEFFATANGDDSVPTWTQIANETRTRLKLNTARFKVDTTRNPYGVDINITRT